MRKNVQKTACIKTNELAANNKWTHILNFLIVFKGPKPAQAHSHVCGMMAMQMEGGLTGYPDLNELARQARPLEFILELIEHSLPDSYAKESWQMNPEEKLKSVTKLRAEGNQLYVQNKPQEASKVYENAIGRLEQLIIRYVQM